MLTEADAGLSMRAATELTGLTEHVIRAWERRYAAVHPTRSAGGTRCFTSADVERLRLLKGAVEAGHSIGAIARLGDSELRELVRPGADAPSYVEDLIELARASDAEGLAAELARLLELLGGRHFAIDVARPVLVRVGALWHEGALSVAQEHLATSTIRRLIEPLLRDGGATQGSPLLLFTTPEGELHEIGALCAGVLAASRNFRAVYLGPNTPVNALAELAVSTRAKAVVLGICALAAAPAEAYLRELERTIARSTRVLVGGEAARRLELPGRVELVDDLVAFEGWLAAQLGKPLPG